jgi:regulator of protease activity HflC (stomatin/prohibitin superfamily)
MAKRNSNVTFGGVVLLLAMGSVLGGCGKYDTPKYEEVSTNETAFVVPLEGTSDDVERFNSAAALEKLKVANKRIQIPRRKSSTGYMWWDFEYIDSVRVIKVDRTPVTVKWEDTATQINLESRDSVGFSTNFSVTASIAEADTAQYLYNYRDNALSNVLNTEVRARVQGIMTNESAKYGMDELRNHKQEMVDAVRTDIVAYYAKRGITISQVSLFGGLEYENKAIQEAIDRVFIAQQLKNEAAAKLAAQKDINERLKQEGEGLANKAREVARGDKDASMIVAEGEAGRISAVAAATKTAGQDPLFYKMRILEVEQKRIEKWNGAYPQWYMPGGAGPQLLVQPQMDKLP